jgi:hypothetical protein
MLPPEAAGGDRRPDAAPGHGRGRPALRRPGRRARPRRARDPRGSGRDPEDARARPRPRPGRAAARPDRGVGPRRHQARRGPGRDRGLDRARARPRDDAPRSRAAHGGGRPARQPPLRLTGELSDRALARATRALFDPPAPEEVLAAFERLKAAGLPTAPFADGLRRAGLEAPPAETEGAPALPTATGWRSRASVADATSGRSPRARFLRDIRACTSLI